MLSTVGVARTVQTYAPLHADARIILMRMIAIPGRPQEQPHSKIKNIIKTNTYMIISQTPLKLCRYMNLVLGD